MSLLIKFKQLQTCFTGPELKALFLLLHLNGFHPPFLTLKHLKLDGIEKLQQKRSVIELNLLFLMQRRDSSNLKLEDNTYSNTS